MHRAILLPILALACGLALGTLLGTGRLAPGLGAGAAGSAGAPVVQNSRLEAAAPQAAPLDPEADEPLLERAQAVLEQLREEDFSALSSLVHPEKGVTLTPFSTVTLGRDRSLTPSQVSAVAEDDEFYVWGVMNGSGAPIRSTPAEYFQRFVYNADYAEAPNMAVDTVLLSGNALENVEEAYPEGRFVDCSFPGLDPELGGYDWCSLKLVFEPWENDWYLVGLVHGEWTT